MLVSCSGDGFDRDNSVRLWDVGTGKELKKLEGHSGYVLCVEWAPDGSQLVSGGEYGEIKLWSPTGECLNTLKGHSNWVVSVAWSINGLLASGSCDKTVKIWNPSAGECLKTRTCWRSWSTKYIKSEGKTQFVLSGPWRLIRVCAIPRCCTAVLILAHAAASAADVRARAHCARECPEAFS